MDSFKIPLATSGSPISEINFWNSVYLYYSSPHLVNRRLLGVSQLFTLEIKLKRDYQLSNLLKYSELYSQVYRIKEVSSENVNESLIKNILDQYGDIYEIHKKNFDDVRNSEVGTFVSVRILLSRSIKCKDSIEVVLFDKKNFLVTFSAISIVEGVSVAPNFPYDIELDKTNLLKICADISSAEDKASDWLVDKLFTKLSSWAEKLTDFTPKQKSLSLISVCKYSQLYQKLKEKYGKELTQNWPENTDPSKFVYEDIAIVTYLLLLWQQTSDEKQKFVDLGCGNGLLVHILNQEGHDGFGIDVRSRKIWSTYPETTKLKVETIVPSADYLFPEVDWIIGNHSDELTPWIPVITARSSQRCKFFLLPCCSYEFNGQKYQRLDSSNSQYSDYLEYIKTICLTCGFRAEIDKLRIPSTKRTCLVGRERFGDDIETVDKNINELLQQKCELSADKWVHNYKTREVVERVRNCTKINGDIVNNIVHKVVDKLLSEKNFVGTNWNAGCKIALPDLIDLLSVEELKEMKSECGGLQTLLRNHHFIFLVHKGMVQIRVPTVGANKNFKGKRRDCWFFKNHPDGCLLSDADCHFIHNKE